MPGYSLRFADLHFHTRYSDNRDRATIGDMIREGRRFSVSIFGVGDHNHNLNARKWRQSGRESDILRRRHPDLLLLNNCEITFLLGHFLVVEPRRITGTIEEGYRFLYEDTSTLKIINHPDPATDEWHRRLVPSAAGIEVVNGAVIAAARKSGFRPLTALDIPMLQTYARYLRLGYPVAAIGNSDAHTRAEMGSGMSGIWLAPGEGKAGVLRAIRERLTFATTDAGIRVHLRRDETTAELAWRVEWRPVDPATPAEHSVELYRGDQRIGTVADSGRLAMEREGWYWLAAFNSRALAVSSPVGPEPAAGGGPLPAAAAGSGAAEDPCREGRRDRVWLGLGRKGGLDLAPTLLPHSPLLRRVELELHFWEPEPALTGADGRKIAVLERGPARERVIIDKSCAAPCFDEFLLWMERNELHEYRFLELSYRKEGNILDFDGLLVPAKMVHFPAPARRSRPEIPRLRRLIGPGTAFRLKVRTLYVFTVRLDLAGQVLPLQVGGTRNGIRSLLIHPGPRTAPHGAGAEGVTAEDSGRRLYQVFLE